MKTTILSRILIASLWFIASSIIEAQGINTDTLFWENRASMHQVRSYFPGLATDGNIYAFGGVTGVNGSLFILSDQIEEYDVDADTWTIKGALPEPMYAMSAVELNGAIYIIGGSTDPAGFTAINKVYRYFPEKGSFDADTIASLPEARGFLSASVLEGVIFAIGGADGFLGAIKKDVYVYDPSSNSWNTIHPLPNGVAMHNSVTFGGTIFLIGGTSNWIGSTNQVLAYDILTGLWWPQSNPLNHSRAALGSAVIDNAIYAFGGISTTSLNELTVEQAPDILTGDPWEVIGNLSYNRRAFGYASAETGGGDWYVYIFGGNSGSSAISSTQRFSYRLVAVQEPKSQDLIDVEYSVVATPNPFNGTTTLSYDLKKSVPVNLSIYNVDGKLVKQLVNSHQVAGAYRIVFEGTNLEPGIYYCKLGTGAGKSGITKMVLVK